MSAVALAAVLSLTIAGEAQAADAQDQAVPTGNVNPSSSTFQQLGQMAQTFTAGSSGQLDRVSLFQGGPGWLQPSITIQIWTVDPSQPTLTNLGTTFPSFTRTAFLGTPTWHDFTLNPAVPVAKGTQYAIVVVSRPSSFWWSYMNWNYAGGNLWLCCDLTGKWMATANQDFGFKTYLAGASVSPPPTVTVDHPTWTATESATPTMTGTFSDPNGDTVTLSATPGTVSPASGKSGTWTWTGTAGEEGSQHVVITADDGHGGVASAAFDFTITDVTPKASIGAYSTSAAIVTVPQEALTFEGSYSDPNSPDSHTATWDFGDGTPPVTVPAPSTSFQATHVYTNAGMYTVRLKVADDDGMTDETSYPVTIETTPQALNAIRAYVLHLSGLNDGQENSLTVKLDAALDSVNRGNARTANNQLNAFLNELQAYANAGKVSPDVAAALRAAVGAVKASLGSYNRFLEWWPLGL